MAASLAMVAPAPDPTSFAVPGAGPANATPVRRVAIRAALVLLRLPHSRTIADKAASLAS